VKNVKVIIVIAKLAKVVIMKNVPVAKDTMSTVKIAKNKNGIMKAVNIVNKK